MKNQVTFKQWKCVAVKGAYIGGTALRLHGAPGEEYAGEPIAAASVNIYPKMYENPEDVPFKFSKDLPKDQVYIKTWGGNEGMVEALEEAGIIRNLWVTVPVGPYGSQAQLVQLLLK